jgi:hypothetical protein
MSKRKDVFDSVVTALESSGVFSTIYKNNIPVWTQVTNFPSVALVWEKEDRETTGTGAGCRVRIYGELTIYLYARQPAKNSYEDVLSDLIDAVDVALKSSTELQSLVNVAEIESIRQDGGILHPHAMALVSVNMDYYS